MAVAVSIRAIRRALPWFRASYAADWALVLSVLVVSLIVSSAASPYHSNMPDGRNNVNFMYPYQRSTVPSWCVVFLALGVPTIVCVAAQFLLRRVVDKWDAMHDVHHTVLGLMESFAVALFVTETAKPFAGRYRPNYLSVVDNNGDEVDGHKSFPSGHTSVAFSGLFFLTLWLAGKTRMLAPGGGQFWKAVVCGIPSYAAMMVGISRVRDYYHHHSDIVAGCLVGLCCAVMGYHLVFPGLLEKDCHRPRSREEKDAKVSWDLESASLLPAAPDQWYIKLRGTVPMTGGKEETLREAWQTKWRSADKLFTPTVKLGIIVVRKATRDSTWMDRRRSVSVGWKLNEIDNTWTNPAYSFPLSVFSRPDLTWTKQSGTSTEGACSSRACDTYLSSTDTDNQDSKYTAYYYAGTNTPVQMHVQPSGIGASYDFMMTVADWQTGSAVPALPDVAAGAPNYPAEPVCSDKKAASDCSAVPSSYCSWCSAANLCIQPDTTACNAPACSTYKTAGACPSGRCHWCDGALGCTESACPAPASSSSSSERLHSESHASSSRLAESSSASSESSPRVVVHPPDLPCSAHVVVRTELNGLAFARDEIWKDQGAFAWRTQFWASADMAETVYQVMPPYDRTTTWRDDLSQTFNVSHSNSSTCRPSSLIPRTFMFGPLNFTAMEVTGSLRGVVRNGTRVDVLHAVGGEGTSYDLLYAAGTELLLSVNGTFVFELSPTFKVPVPVLCTIETFEHGVPVDHAAFALPSICSGSPFPALPAANSAFAMSCYGHIPQLSSSSTSTEASSSTGALSSSSEAAREVVHPPELPCSAHVVVMTTLMEVALARDEIWVDQGAFAWRTKFWTNSTSMAAVIYQVMPPYDRTTIWRDDLGQTFNTSNPNSTCFAAPLSPRTFMFGPLNFTALEVRNTTRNVVRNGKRVDVLGAVSGDGSSYELVYAAGTDRLISVSGLFIFMTIPVPISSTVVVFEQRQAVNSTAFVPPSFCAGAPYPAAPAATSQFVQQCYNGGRGGSSSRSSSSSRRGAASSHGSNRTSPVGEASSGSALGCALAAVLCAVAAMGL
eukprot:m51a1_g6876 putative lipid phosphate phosphatase 3 (1062) ;mRNA; f:196547-201114